MAKVDQADPRWIVQDRSDGRNVGNYHWDERNITSKATEHLKLVLNTLGVFCNTPTMKARFIDFDIHKDSEMTLLNRKGKFSLFFEIPKLTVEWKAVVTDPYGYNHSDAAGQIIFEDLDQQSVVDGACEVTLDTLRMTGTDKILAFVKKEGPPLVRAVVQRWSEEVKDMVHKKDEGKLKADREAKTKEIEQHAVEEDAEVEKMKAQFAQKVTVKHKESKSQEKETISSRLPAPRGKAVQKPEKQEVAAAKEDKSCDGEQAVEPSAERMESLLATLEDEGLKGANQTNPAQCSTGGVEVKGGDQQDAAGKREEAVGKARQASQKKAAAEEAKQKKVDELLAWLDE